jgi:hypothetical protein
MPIDLTPYGFACSVVGEVRASRTEGERSLFLFNETHTDYAIIRQNLLNACTLIDGGFITCVGVEGEYDFEGWIQEDIVDESEALFAEHGDDAGLIEFFIADAQEMDAAQPGRPHFFFGTCLKLLRPAIQVRRVEDEGLAAVVEAAHADVIAKHALLAGVIPNRFAQWINEGSHAEQAQAALLEYRNLPIQLERDLAFLHNLIAFWNANGGAGAAILNAGAAHQDRLAADMPAEFKFVQIFQTAVAAPGA